MMELTETEVRTLYEKKQAEPFPKRKNVMGILIALIVIMGSVGLWCLLLWCIGKVAGI